MLTFSVVTLLFRIQCGCKGLVIIWIWSLPSFPRNRSVLKYQFFYRTLDWQMTPTIRLPILCLNQMFFSTFCISQLQLGYSSVFLIFMSLTLADFIIFWKPISHRDRSLTTAGDNCYSCYVISEIRLINHFFNMRFVGGRIGDFVSVFVFSWK